MVVRFGWLDFDSFGWLDFVSFGWILLVLVGWVLLVFCLKPTNLSKTQQAKPTNKQSQPTSKANQQAKPTNQLRAIYSNVSQRAVKEPKSINYHSRVPPVHSTKCAFDCPLFHSLALHMRTRSRSTPPPQDPAPGCGPSGASRRTCRRRGP